MRIDSHQHFWSYDAAQYPWMTERLARLRRDFLPADLQPELAATGLDGTVAVQARQTLEESRWLLELASQSPLIRGVVGWVDLRSPNVDEDLARLAAHPKFVGVRHVVQDEPDDRFLLNPDFMRGIGRLKEFDLTYDLLVFPKQLPASIELVRYFPEHPFVLDHIAKPFIRDRSIHPWKEQMAELAQYPNIYCKLSGMVTEADWEAWQPADFENYMEVALEYFGEDRLMFGSDWPVCLLAGSYTEVFGLVNKFIGSKNASLRSKIFGENAIRFYGLA